MCWSMYWLVCDFQKKLRQEFDEAEKRFKVELTVLKDRIQQAQQQFGLDEKQYKVSFKSTSS